MTAATAADDENDDDDDDDDDDGKEPSAHTHTHISAAFHQILCQTQPALHCRYWR